MMMRLRFLASSLRQRGNAVELRHFDIEHGDVGIDAFELVDRVEAGAQRGRHLHVRLGSDPARDHPADDDAIVDHHDPQLVVPGRGSEPEYLSTQHSLLHQKRLKRHIGNDNAEGR